MDHSKQHYYEVRGAVGSDWGWRVYHYDPTGNKVIVVAQSGPDFSSELEAMDAVCEWLEQNNVDAEFS